MAGFEKQRKMITLIVSMLAISTSVNVVWSASLDTLLFKSDKIVCPDGHFTCDDESTCCQLPNDEWSCCVFANAQCCADHLHCCPQGSTCDTVGKSCRSNNGNLTVPAVRTKSRTSLSKPIFTETKSAAEASMTCPDRSVCPYAGAACCRQYTGRFGCCNYPLNVCCDDGLHCCHVGTVCDPIYYRCVPYPGNNNSWTHSWANTTPAQRIAEDVEWVSKPEDSKPVEDANVLEKSTTVCRNNLGSNGICVLDDAVCCDDGLHCCPKGTTCDVAKGHCAVQKLPSPVTPWSTKAVQQTTPATSTMCPDDESQCPDNGTCCPVSGNKWGCCPLDSAVCCADMKHCCPFGSYCTSQGTCATNLQSVRIPLLSLMHGDHN